MNDRLSPELKRAAADTTDIAQPPLHRLLARAESRRRQHWPCSRSARVQE